MKNKLIIQLGNKKIVAEINDNNGPEIPPELCVFLEDEDGVIIQDICLIRPHYDINNKTKEFETNNDFIDCLVWSDEYSEDYTDKFIISQYIEEEE